MKNLKLLLLLPLAALLAAPIFGQNEKLAQPRIVSIKMDAALEKQISLDSNMIKAIESLKDDGDFITMSEGSVRQVANLKTAVEVTWKIKTNVKGRVPEYARLIFASDGKGSSDVFFEGKNTVPKNNPSPPQVQGIFCGSWSAWYKIGTSCDPYFWCFSNAQTACYIKYRRTKQCNSGIRYDDKKVRQFCGCLNCN